MHLRIPLNRLRRKMGSLSPVNSVLPMTFDCIKRNRINCFLFGKIIGRNVIYDLFDYGYMKRRAYFANMCRPPLMAVDNQVWTKRPISSETNSQLYPFDGLRQQLPKTLQRSY